MKIAFADVGGVRTRYLYAGEGQAGPPLILLHGFTDTAQTFWRNLDGLGRSRPVYAPDMIGHGFTEPRPLEGAPPHRATLEHVTAFIDQMGWEQVDIGGSSFGGLISAQYYFKRPQAVRRLIIAGSGMCFEREEAFAQTLTNSQGAMLSVIRDSTAESLKTWMQRAIGSPTAETDQLIPAMLTAYALPGALDYYAAALSGMLDRAAMRAERILDRVEAITAPTLVLWGRDDGASWRRAAEAVERMPDAKLEVFDDCGHLTQLAQPERFNTAVEAFLSH